MKIALEHLTNYIQKAHNYDNRVQFGESGIVPVIVGRHGTGARTGHNPRARVQSQAVMMFLGLALQKPGFLLANTVVLTCSCLFHCQYSLSFCSLSRCGFFYRLSTRFADRYFAKIMYGCHVRFERIFQKVSEFS